MKTSQKPSKKPLNSFFLYKKAMKFLILSIYGDINSVELTKIASDMWKNECEEVKAKFSALSIKEHAEYNARNNAWKQWSRSSDIKFQKLNIGHSLQGNSVGFNQTRCIASPVYNHESHQDCTISNLGPIAYPKSFIDLAIDTDLQTGFRGGFIDFETGWTPNNIPDCYFQ